MPWRIAGSEWGRVSKRAGVSQLLMWPRCELITLSADLAGGGGRGVFELPFEPAAHLQGGTAIAGAAAAAAAAGPGRPRAQDSSVGSGPHAHPQHPLQSSQARKGVRSVLGRTICTLLSCLFLGPSQNTA